MKGTRRSQTVEMLFTPPKMTSPASAHTRTPTESGAMWNDSSITVEMAFTCTPQPMPSVASAVNSANSRARCFMPKARSNTYIAPPSVRPSAVCTRYFTARSASAYLVAMPKTPVTQHQNTAPGPPSATAVPRPMMLPVPSVEASDVVSAPNWLISPLDSGSLANDRRMPKKVFL